MGMKDNVKGHLIDLLKNHLKIHLKEHLKYHEKELSEGPVEEGGKDPGQHWSGEEWAAETGLDQHHLCQPSLQPQDWTSTFSLLNFPTQTGPASSSYSMTGLDQHHPSSQPLLLNRRTGPVHFFSNFFLNHLARPCVDFHSIPIFSSLLTLSTGLSRESITCFTSPPPPLPLSMPLASGCRSDNS